MADTKISAMTAGSALGGTEQIPAIQSAANVAITANQIRTFIGPLTNATTIDPTVSNDNTQGYSAGSLWTNTSQSRLWTCQSAGTGAAVWVRVAPGDHVGLVSSRFYGPPAGSSSATLVVTANVMYALPIEIPTTTTLSALGFSINTLAAGTHGLIGIYSNVAGVPTTLLAQPTAALSCAAATAVTGSFTSNPTLLPDMYWLCAIFDGTPTMVANNAGDRNLSNMIGSDNQGRQFGTGSVNNHLEGASTYASGLPSTAPTLSLSFASAPYLQFKVN